METNYNFEEIWKQKKTDIPGIKEIRSKANAYKKKQMMASVCHIFSLIMTFGMVVWIWYNFPELHLLTKFGMLFMLTALAIFIFQNFQEPLERFMVFQN